MHRLLSTIQAISQARLKGTPRIMGSRRSQSATEKHIATKGIKPRRIATGDGFFTGIGSLMFNEYSLPSQSEFGAALVTLTGSVSPNFQGARPAYFSVGPLPVFRF